MVVRFLSLVILLAGFSSGPAWSQAAAPVKDVKPEGRIHFGNMGGLLPDVKPDEMPEANTPEAKLVLRYCSQCHNAPSPGLHPAVEWEGVFQRMYWRMHQANASLRNLEAPTYGEAEAILGYLKKNGMRSILPNQVRADLPGAREFMGICSQCHPLPDPAKHTADEWKKVIPRMQRHARSMGRFTPNDNEARKILEFLSSSIPVPALKK